MHASLSLQSLRNLPPGRRQVALEAANGSVPAWEQLYHQVRQPSGLFEKKYLPPVYANLDPARIPDVTALDEHPDTETASALKIALSALIIMPYFGTFASAAFPDLWSRIWSWIEFMDTHRGFVARCRGPSEPQLKDQRVLVSLLSVLAMTVDQPRGMDVGRATPGLHAFVARMYAEASTHSRLLPRTGDDAEIIDSIDDQLSKIIVNYYDCVHMEDFLGAFDSREACARVLLDHLRGVLFPPRSRLDPRQIASTLTCAIHCAKHICVNTETGGQALSTAEGVRVLVASIRAEADVRRILDEDNAQNRVLESILTCLHIVLTAGPKYINSQRAFRYDILGAIQVSGISQRSSRMLSPEAVRLFAGILEQPLTDTLAYLPIARAASSNRQRIPMLGKDSEPGPEFRRSALYEPFSRCLQYMDARMIELEAFSSKKAVDVRACDAAECGKVVPTTELKQCSRCRRVLYCSTVCQRNAWVNDNHRHWCSRLANRKNLHYPGTSFFTLGHHEDQFLRFIALNYYSENTLSLLLEQFDWMKKNDLQDCVLEIKFNAGKVEIDISDIEEYSAVGFLGWPANAPPLSRCLVAITGGGGLRGAGGEAILRPYVLRRNPRVARKLGERAKAVLIEMGKKEDVFSPDSPTYNKVAQLRLFAQAEALC
uniref:MYND-type domain-containing protein n=1 Tax=Mycena chlorophos TaxID=658473 RepID=A0ABQ0L0Y1_MYCCL|nr:predicted protein [Mycena chlorophos]